MDRGLTRRDLLKAGAGAGLVALSADALVQRALAAAPLTGKLSDIDHVVILIQENRSFDHYFGTYPACAVSPTAPPCGSSPSRYPSGFGDDCSPSTCVRGNPSVSRHHARLGAAAPVWDGGAMDGFVSAHLASTAERARRRWATTTLDIPFYYALADAFTICDRYHCSVIGPPTPTGCSMSATIDPDGHARRAAAADAGRPSAQP